MSDLFEKPVPDDASARKAAPAADAPLAERLRPRRLEDVVGQQDALGPEAPLGRMLAHGRIASLILWGPPGTGKTTIARLLAERVGMRFVQISAIFSGVADLKKAFAEASERRKLGQATLLFVDEIHRFNRAQQDGFLPFVEDGTITLVGATTENPSFELNAALLSRCQVITLARLDDDALEALLVRAEEAEGRALPLTPDARATLRALADGDGRFLLNLVEEVLTLPAGAVPLDPARLVEAVRARAPVYDKGQEGHYNLISALHKSVRGSDPDAALYWLARMLQAGEDPLFLARRLIRMAVEDIGMADPAALTQTLAARDAYEALGSPEGELALAQATVYVATAPKSNALYMADKRAHKSARQHGSLMPPAHILNAPTKLMQEQGYGAGYRYDHDEPDAFSGQDYFPDEMDRPVYYEPVERGFEREIAKRLQWWTKLRRERGVR
ncbi:replication-associated recombination protein A [Futiania mangrovi]|uniref:Replication-associated recombination protein A n=1 Tax=Futiania mangrovi TaxID=2959716 RepID=A0A9J6PGI8_9PROT|nr:replication-associated recombination protein A [Futiania mangrovii]MCP1335210.1 replication-associated recombination protein A [Futiania mangrovii]